MAKKNRTNYKDKQEKRPYNEREIGGTGLNIGFGKVREDVIPPLRGPKKIKLFEEMVRFDPTIGGFNNMYQSIATSVSWHLKEKDDSQEAIDIKEFIESCLFEDMATPFMDAIKNALTACQYGFSIIEPVYKVRNGKNLDAEKSSLYEDGMIGLAKLSPRYQGSIMRWNYDKDYRKILSVTQRNPITFEEVDIPYKRLLHFKHRSFNNNPEGSSIYYNCVVPYLKKKNTSLQEDIRYERGFDGVLDIQAPATILDPTTKNPAYLQTQQWIRDTAQNIRSGTDVAIAHPEYIKVNILSSGDGNIPDADKIIAREDRNIAVALLSDFFLTSQKSGISGGFTQSKIKLFTNLVKEMLEEIRNVINTKLIKTLVEKNLLNVELAPTIEYSEVQDLDSTNLMLFIQSADKSGLVPPTLSMAQTIMKRLLGNDAPTITQEEFDAYQLRREVQTHGYLTNKTADQVVANIDDEDNIDDSYVEEANENNDNSQ